MDKMLKHVNKLIVTTPKLYTDRKGVGNKKIIYLRKPLGFLDKFYCRQNNLSIVRKNNGSNDHIKANAIGLISYQSCISGGLHLH